MTNRVWDGTPMTDSREQRRRHRRPLIVEVHVSDEDAVYLYTARNVSAGGMFIDAPVPLPPGTRLGLAFKLPGGSPIQVTGEVRWNTDVAAAGTRVRHPGMGVGFVELDAGAALRLRGWVDDGR